MPQIYWICPIFALKAVVTVLCRHGPCNAAAQGSVRVPRGPGLDRGRFLQFLQDILILPNLRECPAFLVLNSWTFMNSTNGSTHTHTLSVCGIFNRSSHLEKKTRIPHAQKTWRVSQNLPNWYTSRRTASFRHLFNLNLFFTSKEPFLSTGIP